MIKLTHGKQRNLANQMDRNFKIVALTAIILVGFSLSIIYHYYQGNILGKPYPYTTFLFTPADRFADFFDARFVADLNPYLNSIVPSAQYPLVNVFDYLFTLLPLNISLEIYIILISIAFAFLTNAFLWGKASRFLRNLHFILPITFLTYPFLFTVDRGNLELLVFVFLLLFLYFFAQEMYTLSTIFLALAIAMKIVPAVLLFLYLPKKKFREVVLSLVFTVLLTIGSLLLFKGGFGANFNFLLHGSNFSFATLVSFVGPENLVQRGVSFFTIFKIIFIETGWLAKMNMPLFLSRYIKLAALFFIPIAAFVVFVEKILWRQVALLVFSMLLLPQISADYKMLHLYLPMFMFIITEDRSRLDIFYLVAFGLLMIPKDYAYFPHVLSDAGTNDISISVMINFSLMVIMSFLIVASSLKSIFSKHFHHSPYTIAGLLK